MAINEIIEAHSHYPCRSLQDDMLISNLLYNMHRSADALRAADLIGSIQIVPNLPKADDPDDEEVSFSYSSVSCQLILVLHNCSAQSPASLQDLPEDELRPSLNCRKCSHHISFNLAQFMDSAGGIQHVPWVLYTRTKNEFVACQRQ